MRRLILILGVLFMAGSFSAAAVPEAVEESDAAEPDEEAAERAQLDRWKALARRDAKGLHFKLRNGKTLRLTNVEDGGESVRYYTFEGYDTAIGFYRVNVGYSEGSGYELISRKNGNRYSMAGPPLASPDNKWLVAIMLDLEVQYNENVIEVHRIEGGKISNERRVVPRQISVNIDPREWGPSSAVWIDTGTIRVERSVLRRVENGNELVPIDPLVFRLESDRWKIYVASGAGAGKSTLLVPFD